MRNVCQIAGLLADCVALARNLFFVQGVEAVGTGTPRTDPPVYRINPLLTHLAVGIFGGGMEGWLDGYRKGGGEGFKNAATAGLGLAFNVGIAWLVRPGKGTLSRCQVALLFSRNPGGAADELGVWLVRLAFRDSD